MIGKGMQKLVGGLVCLSLICATSAFAQDRSSAAKPDSRSGFPPREYRPLPPHFQPRRVIAANIDMVNEAPPPLPSYEQPTIPAQGYLWVPGFWAWRKSVPDYFWVPGTWVLPPQPGLLWTPPYWSRVEGGYAFHDGYWAEQVGFYGGIDYGYGYTGDGYQGGRWENGAFSYNRATNNLGSLGIANVYDQAVAAGGNAGRVSFNGGRRGSAARPTGDQEALADTRHVAATTEQQKHFELAAMDRSLFSKQNKGEPGVAATRRAGVLDGAGITRSSARTLDHAAQSGDDVTTGVNARPAAVPEIEGARDQRAPAAK
jgi:YXWGXW repeat-containing protein